MADFVFNVAKGKAAYYATLPAASDALIVVLVKSGGSSDATLKDQDTLDAILTGGSTECDFTNYVRKTAASVTSTVDDTNDRNDSDFSDITWSTAGGATNNTVAKLIVCYDPDTGAGTDADLIPLTAHDFSVTTDSSDVVAQVATAGFYRAS